jgi:hypothetical protein
MILFGVLFLQLISIYHDIHAIPTLLSSLMYIVRTVGIQRRILLLEVNVVTIRRKVIALIESTCGLRAGSEGSITVYIMS